MQVWKSLSQNWQHLDHLRAAKICSAISNIRCCFYILSKRLQIADHFVHFQQIRRFLRLDVFRHFFRMFLEKISAWRCERHVPWLPQCICQNTRSLVASQILPLFRSFLFVSQLRRVYLRARLSAGHFRPVLLRIGAQEDRQLLRRIASRTFGELSGNNLSKRLRIKLTLSGKMTNKLFSWISLKIAERSEAKSAKRSFASKIKIWNVLTRSFASRFLLRFAQPFLS